MRPGSRMCLGVRDDWPELSSDPLDSLASIGAEETETVVYVVGLSGSGKSVALNGMLAQAALAGTSVVSMDMRGESTRAAAHVLGIAGSPARTALIDLEHPCAGFDPLSEGDPYEAALSTTQAIASASGADFGPQTTEYTLNACMLAAETGLRLTDLEPLFYDESFLLSALGRCRSERLVAFWRRQYLDLGPQKRATVSSPVLNKIAPINAVGPLRTLFGVAPPIDLRLHLDTPGSALLINLNADRLNAAAWMVGGMLLSSLWRAVTARSGSSERSRRQVLCFVDEFEHYQHMPEFESMIVEGRKYKFNAIIAHQNLAQLSPRMRELILGNAGVKLALRCSRTDSAALSRDLTGDPRALDLTGSGVGRGWLWTRRQGCVPIEVNAPILRDTGALTPVARRFLGQVRALTARNASPRRPEGAPLRRNRCRAQQTPQEGPAARAPSEARARQQPSEQGPLEDWLA